MSPVMVPLTTNVLQAIPTPVMNAISPLPVRATVTTGLTQDSEVRSGIEWNLGKGVRLQGRYDNVDSASSSSLGNVGADLRWRLEFE